MDFVFRVRGRGGDHAGDGDDDGQGTNEHLEDAEAEDAREHLQRVHVHRCTCVYMCVHVCICLCECAHVCLDVCARVCVCDVCTHPRHAEAHESESICAQMCACACVLQYVAMSACVSLYVRVYASETQDVRFE